MKQELVPSPDDLLSDASSFYGDDETKNAYAKELKEFNVLDFWSTHAVNYQFLAIREKAGSPAVDVKKRSSDDDSGKTGSSKKIKLSPSSKRVKNEDAISHKTTKTSEDKKAVYFHNRLEGTASGKQTSESIDDFISRLRPSTHTIMDVGDGWIWCANPHLEAPREATNKEDFIEVGYQLLEDLTQQRAKLEEKHPDKPPGSITRLLKGPREFTESEIADACKRYNVVHGKWMLFPHRDDVDQVWHTVAQATWDGELGDLAKVAPYDPHDQKQEQLICVYTKDFSDIDDVKRVLKAMRRLGLVKGGDTSKAIYYKSDAYTYLGLTSGNEWKIKASLYSSRDMFKEMGGPKQRKIR
ncbi:uncharacterized protein AB675_8445 [Cyphellophora attinorum]|uniref:DUF1917-domain-containing protein n=1 Tax=Cyphellophora attinorum TaxID=1664694 RepID=A0A0N0NQX6_9EURO|nr:uncharacterized protein AB675_8445 [Phialophora attinorum]KPI44428.1 hypothetical protein AB675_8445 [Phialophora attinorum]